MKKITYSEAKRIRVVMARRIKKENKGRMLPYQTPMSGEIMDTVNTFIEMLEDGRL